MPLLPNKLRQKLEEFKTSVSAPPQQHQQQHYFASGAQPITSHFLSPPSAKPLQPLQPIAGPSGAPTAGSLYLSITHPPFSVCPPAAFFFACLPDPALFAHHVSHLIRRRLTPSSTPINQQRWRFETIEIALEEKDGLAATSGGKIGISLKWVSDVMRDVQGGKKSMDSAIKEFKGVILHEMVHAIQHDGFGSTHTWFTESIADYVRLLAHLDPPYWKKPGQAKRDRGWETGYEIGGWFLCYLTGQDPGKAPYYGADSIIPSRDAPSSSKIPASSSQPAQTSSAARAQPTRIADNSGSTVPDTSGGNSPKRQRRRPPIPELVALMDARLEVERWNDRWWIEMAGAPLEVLWNEYLDYYA